MRIGFYNLQGGTGKTTVAINIAYLLSEKTKTIYIDCDLYAGTSGVLFGYENDPHNLNSYLSGNSTLDEAIHTYSHLSIIPNDVTPDAFNADMDFERFAEMVDILEETYDIIIFDLPPNITEGNLLFSSIDEKLINKMIIVGEDSIPGIVNTLKTRELLTAIGTEIGGTIINKYRGIVDFEEVLDDVIALLPYDKKVEEQWVLNKPIVEIKSKLSKELIYLAEDLAQVYIEKELAEVRALKLAKELKRLVDDVEDED
ncbi:MinD/ParA family ATP-binding protein [Methanotorris formicicus]|nr:MinD/ParA family protein [Methanotorris formicicus]